MWEMVSGVCGTGLASPRLVADQRQFPLTGVVAFRRPGVGRVQGGDRTRLQDPQLALWRPPTRCPAARRRRCPPPGARRRAAAWPSGAARRGRVAGVRTGQGELRAGVLAGDQGLPQPGDHVPEHRVQVAGDRVDGEQHAGQFCGHHGLDDHSHLAGPGGAGRGGIGLDPLGPAGLAHLRDGSGEAVGRDVQHRLVRTGEGCGSRVLGEGGGADREQLAGPETPSARPAATGSATAVS